MISTVSLPYHCYTPEIKCANHMKNYFLDTEIAKKQHVDEMYTNKQTNQSHTYKTIPPTGNCPVYKKSYICIHSRYAIFDGSEYYIMLCPYHKDKFVVLTNKGRVVMFDKRQPSIVQRLRANFICFR